MRIRILTAGILAGIFMTTSGFAEPKAITLVTRAAPVQGPIVLPELSGETASQLASVELSDPVREHRSAALKSHDDLSAFGLPCGAHIEAALIADGTYQIRVTDSCRPNESVAFAVNGMRFDLALSLTGEAEFELPALSDTATLETVFADGEYKSTPLAPTDVTGSLRIAMAWKSGSDTSLVAAGHDVITLGDGQHRLQILKLDRTRDTRETIRLSIRRDITGTSCDRPASAHYFKQTGSEHPTRYDLSFAPVACARQGETLELKNILEDLTLASN